MYLERYTIISDNYHRTYDFFSVGPKGIIMKRVYYQEIRQGAFNLVFGDWNEREKKIEDDVRSNNNDRDKILATVAATVVDFIRFHPTATIFAIGFTSSRTRLYRMGIQVNWQQINESFNIKGFKDCKWEAFKKDQLYEMFSLRLK
jgi:hypothetical protein